MTVNPAPESQVPSGQAPSAPLRQPATTSRQVLPIAIGHIVVFRDCWPGKPCLPGRPGIVAQRWRGPPRTHLYVIQSYAWRR